MSKSLNVTSSAKVFLTPMVPHRVGLIRRDENDPSLHTPAFEPQAGTMGNVLDHMGSDTGYVSSTLVRALKPPLHPPAAVTFTGSIITLNTPPSDRGGRDLAGVAKVSSLPL